MGLIKKKSYNITSQKNTSNKSKAVIQTGYLPVFFALFLFFVYGFELLLVSYTGSNILSIASDYLNKHNYLAPLMQSLGLVITTLCLGKLMKAFNLRYIMMAGFLGSVIFLILTGNIDHIVGYKGGIETSHQKHAVTACYFVFNLGLGISIGGVSPGIVTFFSRRFSGTTKTKMLSVLNALYGIGGGIIPLALAGVLYKHSTSAGISPVRNFYYVSAALGLAGCLLSFFVSVPKVEADELKIKTNEKSVKKISTSNFRVILMLIVVLFFSYLFIETVSNYSIKLFVTNDSPDNNADIETLAIRCAGLMFLVQGVWRMIAGLFINPKMKLRHYVYWSIVLLILSYIFILTKQVAPGNSNSKVLAWAIPIFIGIGIGNIWPVLVSYVTQIDTSKASIISLTLNRTAMIGILVTQIINGLVVTPKNINGSESWSNNSQHFYALYSIAIFVAIVCGLTLHSLSLFLRNKNIVHDDDVMTLSERFTPTKA